MGPYCGSLPTLVKAKKNGKIFYGLQMQTRSFPCFTKIGEMFYPNGVKIVPQDIFHYLDPIVLAF